MAAHHFAPCVQSDNRNKLRIALALIGAIAGVVNKPVRVLFDSWFMRAGLVLPLLRRGIHVIAQARIDTALLFPPRSRTGPAWPASKVWRTAEQGGYRGTAAIELTMRLYGKEQRVRLRSTTALARFLKGLPVHGRVVPVIRRAAADMDKGPPDRCHGKRSGRANDRPAVRAPMGYRTAGSQPEAAVGLDHLWQHTRTVLELWIQIRSCAWSLMQLLSLAVADATQCASSETVTRCAQPSACVRSSFHRVARFIAHYHTVSARVTAGCLKFST
jgi:hypothetical protein